MTKTFSVGELGHGGASRAVRAAQQEPVLVSKENRPAAWILSAEKLAEVAAARGVAPDVYQHALELLSVELYQDEVLTIGPGDGWLSIEFNVIDLATISVRTGT